ncbi:MAG: polyketide cyclase / dehydrase and lipid transport [Actinomycetota bacterium]|nr:polyketide cyclase / dehydrase and lipid transport [Actinomycetota bacterium]
MPALDLIDETYLVAEPATVAARIRDPELWRTWWPALHLSVYQDRGEQGLRWTVTGTLVGSSEIWLEPCRDGVLLHYYLRAELTGRGSDTEVMTGRQARVRRRALAAGRRHSAELKRALNALKDELEAGRPPGTPRPGTDAPPADSRPATTTGVKTGAGTAEGKA